VTCKNELRPLLLEKRRKIPFSRREAAEQNAFSILSLHLSSYFNVLSFASLPGEINLWKINEKLANEKRLLLPAVENKELKIYAVSDLKKQLRLSSWNIWEPIPQYCQEIFPQEIACILVPGLAFDAEGNRIGYGKGFYDRLLAQMKCLNPEAPAFGIALHEQHFLEKLPSEEHDQKLTRVLYF